jgi:hypothetical protein
MTSLVFAWDISRATAPVTKFQAQIRTPVVPPAVAPVVRNTLRTVEDQSVAEPVLNVLAANVTTPDEADGSDSDCLA